MIEWMTPRARPQCCSDRRRALRVRLDLNRDAPLPPEIPAGTNPPNGANGADEAHRRLRR